MAQLFEFMDYDITGYDVYVNNELADKDTKVYENFSVKTSAITEHAGYEEISEEKEKLKPQFIKEGAKAH